MSWSSTSPLPSHDDLRAIVRTTFENAKLAGGRLRTMRAAPSTRCLGWRRFRRNRWWRCRCPNADLTTTSSGNGSARFIEQAPGLTVWRGGEGFTDVGGCANVKAFLQSVLDGAEAPRVVVFCDEIEKAFAGTGNRSVGRNDRE